MCAKMCPDDEECRYDKENYEYHGYKCPNPNYSKIMIWAPIYVAVAGTVIIGLLIFFVVRYFKNKAQIRKTINKEKQPDNEVPYQYTINRDDTQNESVNIENEETSLYEAYQSAEYETYDETELLLDYILNENIGIIDIFLIKLVSFFPRSRK